MPRVLIVSPHFPPDSTAGTHRARLIAPRLREHGWEPTVLTVDPRDYEGDLDPVLGQSVPADLRVIRARAWPVRLTRPFGVGDLGLRAFDGLWREASHLLSHERFDALFITIYPAYTALLGPLLKKRFGVPFVLDYQDPWVGEWGLTVGPGANGQPDLRSRLARAVAGYLEPVALRAADAVTAVSRGTYEPALQRNPRARPVATAELPIGWDERDFEFLRAHPATARLIPTGDGLVHLACIGTLPPTMHASLRAFLTALARLRDRDPARAGAIRVHFFGTSSLRSDRAPLGALPVARELGVEGLVTEAPARLNYFDALRALDEATALLLLGTTEAHYTPSRMFTAMLSGRPLLAIYHAASPATALLRRFGGPPAVYLIGFDNDRPASGCVDEIFDALAALASRPAYGPAQVDRGVLAPASATVLAGRLAGIFDRVSARRDA
ncbi:MAG: glycosyltransferase [Acidobacteriia bacterium]|nr:glycosyltransferase [Terriglobia bacterium]